MNDHTNVAAWQLDQNSAAAYEEFLVGRIFRRWAQRLVTYSNAAPDERVLDAGCGTGIVARTVASHVAPGGSVVGVDLNEGMIAEARRQETANEVTWRVGDLERLPFEDGSFELVLIEQVLQFIPNRDRALAEARRVLAPGGRVVLALLRDLEFNRSYEVLAGVLDRHAGSTVGDMMRSPFAGPGAEDILEELNTAGFRELGMKHDVLDVRYPSPAEYLRQEAASSPLAGPLGELDNSTLEALIVDLDNSLTPFTDDAGVVFPMETYFVRGYR